MMISIKVIFVSALLLESNKFILSMPSIGDIQEIANFANDAWGVLNGDLPISALLTGSTGVMLDKILDAVAKISEKMDEVIAAARGNSRKLNKMQNLIQTLMHNLPREAKLDMLTREFNAYIDRIDYFYEKFTYYSANRDNFNNKTINKYINGIVSFKQGDLRDVINRLHLLFSIEGAFPQENLLHTLASPIAGESGMCDAGISRQTRMYHIYKIIVIAEIRTYVMTLFAYSIKKVYIHNTTFYDEITDAKDQLILRSKNLIDSFKMVMTKMVRFVEICDLEIYEEDVTCLKHRNRLENSDDVGHTFYTVPKTTDIANNKVVTGMRFVKDNEMIHIQLKEAQLLPQGNVDVDDERWIPIPKIVTKIDKGVDRYYDLESNEPLKYPDIFVVTNTNRTMILDQIALPPGLIMTGVKIHTSPDGVLYVDVQGTKFDFETGKLSTDSIWHGLNTIQQSNRPPRKHLDLYLRVSPLIATEKKTNIKDALFDFNNLRGESGLLPFFDSRTLQLYPRGPLSGIGLALRVGRLDGGILNLQILPIDYSHYMKSTI